MNAQPGSRLEVTNEYVKRVEDEIRKVVAPEELRIIVSNIGVTPGFSSIYTSNSGQHTAFIQVGLKEGHKTGSYEYMNRVRGRCGNDIPDIRTYFPSGGLGDAILNLGLTAPLVRQARGRNLERTHQP